MYSCYSKEKFKMNELKMPQVGASRSEIVANWQPDNPEFWEKFGK